MSTMSGSQILEAIEARLQARGIQGPQADALREAIKKRLIDRGLMSGPTLDVPPTPPEPARPMFERWRGVPKPQPTDIGAPSATSPGPQMAATLLGGRPTPPEPPSQPVYGSPSYQANRDLNLPMDPGQLAETMYNRRQGYVAARPNVVRPVGMPEGVPQPVTPQQLMQAPVTQDPVLASLQKQRGEQQKWAEERQQRIAESFEQTNPFPDNQLGALGLAAKNAVIGGTEMAANQWVDLARVASGDVSLPELVTARLMGGQMPPPRTDLGNLAELTRAELPGVTASAFYQDPAEWQQQQQAMGYAAEKYPLTTEAGNFAAGILPLAMSPEAVVGLGAAGAVRGAVQPVAMRAADAMAPRIGYGLANAASRTATNVAAGSAFGATEATLAGRSPADIARATLMGGAFGVAESLPGVARDAYRQYRDPTLQPTRVQMDRVDEAVGRSRVKQPDPPQAAVVSVVQDPAGGPPKYDVTIWDTNANGVITDAANQRVYVVDNERNEVVGQGNFSGIYDPRTGNVTIQDHATNMNVVLNKQGQVVGRFPINPDAPVGGYDRRRYADDDRLLTSPPPGFRPGPAPESPAPVSPAPETPVVPVEPAAPSPANITRDVLDGRPAPSAETFEQRMARVQAEADAGGVPGPVAPVEPPSASTSANKPSQPAAAATDQETISGVAWTDPETGKVYTGGRTHADIIPEDAYDKYDGEQIEDAGGFTTSTGRVVDREEAAAIAYKAKQIADDQALLGADDLTFRGKSRPVPSEQGTPDATAMASPADITTPPSPSTPTTETPRLDDQRMAAINAAAAKDAKFADAVDAVMQAGKGSVSVVQRALNMGYTRAARLIELMNEAMVIRETPGSVDRPVVMSAEEWQYAKDNLGKAVSVDQGRDSAPGDTQADAPAIPTSPAGVPKFGIYTTNVSGRGTVYAVRTSDKEGGFGDTIHATLEDAQKYAAEEQERQRRNAESAKNREAAERAKADAKAKSDARRENQYGEFTKDMRPMNKARVAKALDREMTLGGGPVKMVGEHVADLVAQGATLSADEEWKIAEPSRRKWFQMSAAEQNAWERRREEAGKEVVYRIGGHDLGKTAYEYAKFLKERGGGTTRTPWREAHDAETDPFRRAQILEAIATLPEATEQELSDVLSRLDEASQGGAARRVAYAVANKPSASAEVRARAQAMYDAWASQERDDAPTPPGIAATSTATPTTSKQPWQMTKAEYVAAVMSGEQDFTPLGVNPTSNKTLRTVGNVDELRSRAEKNHDAEVTTAFAENKPVPAEILAEYDLPPKDAAPAEDSNKPNTFADYMTGPSGQFWGTKLAQFMELPAKERARLAFDAMEYIGNKIKTLRGEKPATLTATQWEARVRKSQKSGEIKQLQDNSKMWMELRAQALEAQKPTAPAGSGGPAPIIGGITEAIGQSIEQHEAKVSNLRYGTPGQILFEYDGKTYTAPEPKDVMPVGSPEGNRWAAWKVVKQEATPVDATQAANTPDEPPSFRDWRWESTHKNAGVMIPNRVGAKFTNEQQATLKAWAEARGLTVTVASPTRVRVIGDVGKSLWLSKYGIEGVKAEKAEVAKQARKSADAVREQQLEDQASTRQSAPWIIQTFGEGFANAYNRNKLADYLERKEAQPRLLTTSKWEPGLRKLGAIDADGNVVFEKIREAYEAETTKQSPSASESPQTYRYATKYRPAGIATAPKGFRFVESGDQDPLPNRPELPRSKVHKFGVIEYDRPLTPEEVSRFELIDLNDDPDVLLETINGMLDRGVGRNAPEVVQAFQALGNALVPGVRVQDAEETGRLYHMLDKGDATLAEFTSFVEELRKSGKAPATRADAKAKPERTADTTSTPVSAQTPGAITQRGVSGFKESYSISLPDGSRVSGSTGDADFPGLSSEATRGEIFSIQVADGKRREGLGTSLIRDAVQLIAAAGGRTIKLTVPNKTFGQPFVDALIKRGVLGQVLRRDERTGTLEVAIPQQVADLVPTSQSLRVQANTLAKHYDEQHAKDAAVAPGNDDPDVKRLRLAADALDAAAKEENPQIRKTMQDAALALIKNVRDTLDAGQRSSPSGTPRSGPTDARGYLVPQEGDDVFQQVPGFGGTPAYVYGKVVRNRKGDLRVRVTGSASMFGAAKKGATTSTSGWFVKGDPEIERRRRERDEAEAARKANSERSFQEGEQYRAKSRADAIASGHKTVDTATPRGAVLAVHNAEGEPTRAYLESVTDDGVSLVFDDEPTSPRGYNRSDVTDTGERVDLDSMQRQSVATYLKTVSDSELADFAQYSATGGDTWYARYKAEIAAEQTRRNRSAGADTSDSVDTDAIAALWMDEARRINPNQNYSQRAVTVAVENIVKASQTGVYNDSLHPSNAVSRAVFQKVTGVTLPRTVSGTKAVFDGTRFPIKVGGAGSDATTISLTKGTTDEVPNDATAQGRGESGSGDGVPGGLRTTEGQSSPTSETDGEGGGGGSGQSLASGGDAVPQGGGAAGRPRRGRGSGKRGGDTGGVERADADAEPRADADGTDVQPGPRTTAKPAASTPRERPQDVSALNHVINDGDVIAPRGDKGKIKANIAAIKLLKQLEAENRNATPDEKKVLAQYTAWGGLAPALDSIKGGKWAAWLELSNDPDVSEYVKNYRKPDEDTQRWADKWYDTYKTIRDLMTREEFRDAQETTQYAHYTSADVIRKAIWPIAEQLGFDGGLVLETSAGVGHMLGLQPAALAEKSRWVAVEKDAIPARLLEKLYPESTVLGEPFEKAKLKPATFDLVVGNVPFARSGPTDKRYPSFSLHNYFLARSIDMLRPGGLMVAITSRSTMDEPASQGFRDWANARADLVGAIRLPNTAFMDNAGTKVTTDILVFRKRDGVAMTGGKDWTSLRDIEVDNTTTGKKATTPLNEYYVKHPEMLMGQMVVGRGLYSDEEPMMVGVSAEELPQRLVDAINQLPKDIAIEGSSDDVKVEKGVERSFQIDTNGKPYRLVNGVREYVPDKHVKVVKAFVAARQDTLNLYDAQVNPNATDAEIEATRAKVRAQYQAFVQKHGRINENWDVLNEDPDFYRVAALEIRNRTVKKTKRGNQTKYVYDYTYSDSDVLTKRTQFPTIEPQKADNLEDALAISEAWRGGFDVEYVAALLNKSADQVRHDMLQSGNAFVDPDSGMFVAADEYLSGNIRAKLDAAKAANDPAYAGNIAALQSSLPPRVALPQVSFALGAQWIPPHVYEAFAVHYVGSPVLSVAKMEGVNMLTAAAGRRTSAVDEQKGAGGWTASQLIAAKINLEPIRTTMDIPADNKQGFSTVTDPEATAAAQFQAEQIDAAFQAWAKGSEHALELEDVYNDTFNGSVARNWKIPAIERFPGASPLVTLKPHQRRAVFRGLRESYLNANEVGTGKTFIMISLAMEQRRLGLARKPMIVVQNSTLPQIADAFARLYPSARVLVPTKVDLEAANRKRLLNLIASNDWDAVLLPQSQFNLLPDRPERTRAFVMDQIDELEAAIVEAGGNVQQASRSSDPKVKAMGRRLTQLRKFFDQLMDRKVETQAGTFEDMGVDSLLVDEAHAYKKLAFITNLESVKGLDTGFSQRGLTLLMKARWVQERRGGKNVTLFTGTPITNTLAEAWTMMRYVRPDLLKQNGIVTFDQFVTAFARRSTEYELVAGVKLKEVERLREFVNLPELQRLWLQIADEVRAQDVGISRPPIKTGGRQIQTLSITPTLEAYMRGLLDRYEWFENLTGKQRYENRHVPGQINSLARAAAIDMRLVDPKAADDPGSKTNAIVNNVYRIWKETQEQGLTQAIIIDRFQRGEKGDGSYFNVFHAIRDKLIALGVPADEIAVMTDSQYDDPDKRGPVFQAVNDRVVRIVMGTTDRLGVGVNIQQYLVALHHGDVPYRPADMEQREGRINRQGNLTHQDFGVEPEILGYGVEKSFDAGGYERLSRKQKMQEEARNGKFVGRSIEDDADDTLSYAAAAAELLGDPDFKRKATVESEIRQLAAAQESHQTNILNTRRRIQWLESQQIPLTTLAIDRLKGLASNVKEFEDNPVLDIDGESFQGKAIVDALTTKVGEAIDDAREVMKSNGRQYYDANIGTLTVNGVQFRLLAEGVRTGPNEVAAGVRLQHQDLSVGYGRVETGRGVWGRLQEAMRSRSDVLQTQTAALASAKAELEQAKGFVTQAFPHEAELSQKRQEVAEITARLAAKDNSNRGNRGQPGGPDDATGASGAGTSLAPKAAGLRPIASVKAMRNLGFDPLQSVENSTYVTDGKALVRLHSVGEEQARALQGLPRDEFAKQNDATLESVWTMYTEKVKPATLLGTAMLDADRKSQAFALVDDGERLLTFDAGRVKAIGHAIGATQYALTEGKQTLVFLVDNKPAALLMAKGTDVPPQRSDYVAAEGSQASNESSPTDPENPDVRLSVSGGYKPDASVEELRAYAAGRGVDASGGRTAIRERVEADRDVQGIQQALRRSGAGDVVVARVDPQTDVERDLHALLKRAGLRPVFVRITGDGGRIEGAYLGRRDGRVYIRSGLTDGAARVALHEAMHAIRQEKPELYRALVAALGEQAVARAADGYRRKLVESFGENSPVVLAFDASADAQQDEGVAELVGSMASDPDVMAAIRAKPGLWTRIKAWVAAFLERMGFGNEGAGLRKAVLDLLRKMQDGEPDTGPRAQDGDAVAMSVRSQTDTPEFKAWFGDSKVVDANGKPRVLYHGTRSSFTVFRPSDAPGWGKGIYLSNNAEQVADEFAGPDGVVMPVYVSLQNPYVDKGQGFADIVDRVKATKAWQEYQKRHPESRLHDVLSESGGFVNAVLRELGYDGVIAENSNNIDGLEVVAFRPEQVKSATGNVGTFDPTNPDIRFSVSGKPALSRKEVVAEAKALGLPATGTTESIANRVRILKADPSTWTRADFDAVKDSLAIHQDVRPGSDERVASIMRDGLRSGMVDSVGAMDRKAWTWAKQLMGGDVYVFSRMMLEFFGDSAWLKPGNKPLFHFKAEKGQDLYEAMTGRRKGDERNPLVDTPRFKEWMGDSKVVDDQGRPLMVFHQTPQHDWNNGDTKPGEFTKFDRMAVVKAGIRPVSMDNVGNWFAASPNGPWGDVTYPVYLSIQNPWTTTWDNFIAKLNETAGRAMHAKGPLKGRPADGRPIGQVDPEPLRSWLKQNGYDGIKFPATEEIDGVKADVWVTLEDTQIKSAYGNDGTYGRDTGEIRFSVSGKPATASQWADEAAAKPLAKDEERPAVSDVEAAKLVVADMVKSGTLKPTEAKAAAEKVLKGLDGARVQPASVLARRVAARLEKVANPTGNDVEQAFREVAFAHVTNAADVALRGAKRAEADASVGTSRESRIREMERLQGLERSYRKAADEYKPESAKGKEEASDATSDRLLRRPAAPDRPVNVPAAAAVMKQSLLAAGLEVAVKAVAKKAAGKKVGRKSIYQFVDKAIGTRPVLRQQRDAVNRVARGFLRDVGALGKPNPADPAPGTPEYKTVMGERVEEAYRQAVSDLQTSAAARRQQADARAGAIREGMNPAEGMVSASDAAKASYRAQERLGRKMASTAARTVVAAMRQARQAARAEATAKVASLQRRWQRRFDRLKDKVWTARTDLTVEQQRTRARRRLEREIRRELTDVIRKYMPRSLRGDYITMVRDATTPGRLNDALVAIQHDLTFHNAKEATRLGLQTAKGKWVERIRGDKAAKAAYDAAVQTLMDAARRLKETNTVAKQPQPANLTNMAGGTGSVGTTTKRMSVDDLLALQDRVEQAHAELLFLRKDAAEKEQIRVEGKVLARETVVESVLKSLALRPDLARPLGLPAATRTSLLGRYHIANATPDTIAAMLRNPLARKLLVEELWRGETDAMADTYAATDEMKRLLAAAGFEWGSEKLHRLSYTSAGPDAQQMTLNLPDAGKITASPGEWMAVLATLARESSGRKILEEGRPITFGRDVHMTPVTLTAADADAISDALDKMGLVSVVHGGMKFMSGTADALNKAYYSATGRYLKLEPLYFPTHVNRDQQPIENLIGAGPQYVRRALENLGFLQPTDERATSPYLIKDFFDEYNQYTHASAIMVHMTDRVRAMEAVFKDRRILAEIERKFGSDMNERLDRMIEAGKLLFSEPKSRLDKLAVSLGRKIAKAELTLNPGTWVKQFGSVPKLYAVMDAEHIAAGIEGMMDPVVTELLKNDAYFRNRIEDAVYRRMSPSDYKRSPSLGQVNTADAIKRIMEGGVFVTERSRAAWGSATDRIEVMNWFDGISSRVAIGAALSMGKAKGLTGQALLRYAAWEAQMAIRRVNNTSSVLDMSGWAERNRGNWLSLSMLFTSDANKNYNLIAAAFEDQGGKVAGKKMGRAIVAIAASNLWGAMIGALINTLTRYGLSALFDDDEAREALMSDVGSQFVRSNLGSLYFGDVIYDLTRAGYRVATKQPVQVNSVFETPVSSKVADATEGAIRFAKSFEAQGRYTSGRNRGEYRDEVMYREGLWQMAEAISGLMGNPLLPWMRYLRKYMQQE